MPCFFAIKGRLREKHSENKLPAQTISNALSKL